MGPPPEYIKQMREFLRDAPDETLEAFLACVALKSATAALVKLMDPRDRAGFFAMMQRQYPTEFSSALGG